MKRFKLGASCFFLTQCLSAHAALLDIAGFNVEDIDANATVIAKQISQFDTIDVWGLAESNAKFEQTIIDVLDHQNRKFGSVAGTTGGNQKLHILYNKKRLTLKSSFELHDINPGMRVRSPLVAQFEDNDTHKKFYFVVNHLYRSKAPLRHEQAKQLNAWGKDQNYPVIQVGDFNFDLNPKNPDEHDRGFDYMTANGVFYWAKPDKLIPTQCSHYQSVLDFVFVNQGAKDWLQSATILNDEPDYCPDDSSTSDHRPMAAQFDL